MVGSKTARISVFILLLLALTLSSPLSGSVAAQDPLEELLDLIGSDDEQATTKCGEFGVSAFAHARERGDGVPFVEVEIRYFGSSVGTQRESSDGGGSSLAREGVSESGVFIGVEAKAFATANGRVAVSECTWGIIPDPQDD